MQLSDLPIGVAGSASCAFSKSWGLGNNHVQNSKGAARRHIKLNIEVTTLAFNYIRKLSR